MIIFKRILGAYYFIKGRNNLQVDNDMEALEYFKKANKYINDSWDITMSKAFTEALLQDYENSIMSFQYTLQLIDKHKKMNSDEKNYLRYYCLQFLIRILDRLENYNNYEKYIKMYKELTFDMKKVRRYITKNYPLRGHVQWDASYE